MNAPRTPSQTELAELIHLNVHPSVSEPGYIPEESIDRGPNRCDGWRDFLLTRLEIPASPTGFGTLWIDYEDANTARVAYDRARQIVLDAATPEDGFAALESFYQSE